MNGLSFCGDVRRFRSRELRHPGLLGDDHVDDRRPGIDRAHDRIGARIDRLLDQRARGLRVGLRVVVGHVDLLAEDAARGIDLVHRNVCAIAIVGSRNGAGARKLADAGDQDGVVGASGVSGAPPERPRQSALPRQSRMFSVALQFLPLNSGFLPEVVVR